MGCNTALSFPYFQIDQPPSIYDSVQQVIKNKNVAYLKKTKLLDSLSRSYHKKENYKEALRYALQAITLHKKHNNDSLVNYYNEKIGVMFYYLGNYDSSLEYLLEALTFSKKQNLSLKQAQILGNIANVYTRLDKYDQAIDYLLNAKQLYEKYVSEDSLLLAGIYINVGLAYERSGILDSATFYYNNALSLIQNKGNALYEASIYNNKGEIDFKQGNYDVALNFYQKASVRFQDAGNENGMGTALLNIARVYFQRNKYKLTVRFCEKALVHFQKINSLFNIVETEKLLSDAYKEMGEYKKAISHMERYNVFNDSLKGNKTQEYIANLEMQSMTLKEQQKYELYKQNAELRESKLQVERLYLYLTIGGVCVLLIVVSLILLNMRKNLQHNKLKQKLLRQEQTRMQNDITFKQREIENFANHIREKNKLLKDLSSEIKRITKSTNQDINELKSLKDIVNQSIYMDENRKELELKIDHAHQQFIQRLKSKFPALSKTEIRLCSLLLLKFSSKEIAAIMNIEPTSVKTSRNRLRKKLGLPPRSDINMFLSTI